MKPLLLFIMVVVAITGCDDMGRSNAKIPSQENQSAKTYGVIDNKQVQPPGVLTLSDAEKILGEPARLSDSVTAADAKVLKYNSSYVALSKDERSGKTGNLYFLLEHFAEVSSAKNKYSFIKKANEDHGIKEIKDLGDEAYFHSDGVNFYFIMARKGEKVFNMKVNKITSKTSLDELYIAARKIVVLL